MANHNLPSRNEVKHCKQYALHMKMMLFWALSAGTTTNCLCKLFKQSIYRWITQIGLCQVLNDLDIMTYDLIYLTHSDRASDSACAPLHPLLF